jgi:hypothetical protein
VIFIELAPSKGRLASASWIRRGSFDVEDPFQGINVDRAPRLTQTLRNQLKVVRLVDSDLKLPFRGVV